MPYVTTEGKRARSLRQYLRDPAYFKTKTARWKKDNPKRYAFLGQRHTSKQRGVEFNLTFEEWIEFWGGDFFRRGRRSNDLQMCRYGDKGAYEVGNIYKATKEQNKKDHYTNKGEL